MGFVPCLFRRKLFWLRVLACVQLKIPVYGYVNQTSKSYLMSLVVKEYYKTRLFMI